MGRQGKVSTHDSMYVAFKLSLNMIHKVSDSDRHGGTIKSEQITPRLGGSLPLVSDGLTGVIYSSDRVALPMVSFTRL